MGNSTHSQDVTYRLKQGTTITINKKDLKDAKRFPSQPSSDQGTPRNISVDKMFEDCLRDITLTPEQASLVETLSTKRKFRLAVRHRQALKKLEVERQLDEKAKRQKAAQTTNLPPEVITQLETHLREIQSVTPIKPVLNKLEAVLIQHHCHRQFLQLFGLEQIVHALERHERRNREGSRTNFTNQVELLRFLRVLSQSTATASFTQAVTAVPNYATLLLRNFHPVNIEVSWMVLELLTDFVWRTEDSDLVVAELRVSHSCFGYREPILLLLEVVASSDNLLMVLGVVRFINALLASFIEDEKLRAMRKWLREHRYELILDDVRNRILQHGYKLEHCTFEWVQRRIYEWKGYEQRSVKETRKENRTPTMTLNDIVAKLVQSNLASTSSVGAASEPTNSDVYLTEDNRKFFVKCQLDLVNQIEGYYRLENSLTGETHPEKTTVVEKQTIGKELERVMKVCDRTNSQQLFVECIRGMQEFTRENWKQLKSSIKHITGAIETKEDAEQARIELVRKQEVSLLAEMLEEREALVRELVRENKLLREESCRETKYQQNSQNQKEEQQNSQGLSPPEMPKQLSLPTPPSPPISSGIEGLPQLPPPPTLVATQTKSEIILPPPPPLDQMITSESAILPPLPALPSLSLPPTLSVPFGTTPPSGSLPPPPLLFAATNAKPKCHPSVPMKPCNISLIPAENIKSTVWQKLDDTTVEIDKTVLEALFHITEPLRQSKFTSQVSMQKETTKLLESDRSRNIEIILKKLRKPVEELCQGLLTGRLPADVLENMKSILPTQEEQALVNGYTGDPGDLALPEKYFRELQKISAYRSRVHALLFLDSYEDECVELEQRVAALGQAFKDARENPRLHYVLEVTLAVCNYLNGEGSRGGASGFKLDSFERIEQTKSQDGKENVAFYVVRQVWRKYESPIFGHEEIEHLRIMGKTSVRQTQADLGALRKNLGHITQAIASQTGRSNDKIAKLLEEMEVAVTHTVQLVESLMPGVTAAYESCAQFYGEDTKRQSSDEFGKKILECLFFVSKTEEAVTQLDSCKRRVENQKAIHKPHKQDPHHAENLLSELLGLVLENTEITVGALSGEKMEIHGRKIPEAKQPISVVEANRRNMETLMEEVRRKREEKRQTAERKRKEEQQSTSPATGTDS